MCFDEIAVKKEYKRQGLSRVLRTRILDLYKPSCVVGIVSSVLSVESRVKTYEPLGFDSYWMNNHVFAENGEVLIEVKVDHKVEQLSGILVQHLYSDKFETYLPKSGMVHYRYPREEGNQFGVIPGLDGAIQKMIDYETAYGCFVKGLLISVD